MGSINGVFSSVRDKIIIFVLLNFVLHVLSDTVHFTNSQSQLERSLQSEQKTEDSHTKTYKLEVPGSHPITIIEATPASGDDSYNERRQKVMTEIKLPSNPFNENNRKTKDFIVPGSTHEMEVPLITKRNYNIDNRDTKSGRCFGPSCHEMTNPKKTVYSPDLLNKFLKEYADKIKNADQTTKDQLQQMESDNDKVSFGIVVADKSYQKNRAPEMNAYKIQEDDEKTWERHDAKKYQHPYDDRDGWVALEAVPWSRSKISKWQPNPNKMTRPSNFYGSFDNDQDKFSSPGYDKPDPENDYDNRPYNSPPHAPSQDTFNYKPGFGSGHNDWQDEAPSRPYNPYNNNNNKPAHKPTHHYPDWSPDSGRRPHRPDCDHENKPNGYDDNIRRVHNKFYDDDGIITDGQPGDFPTSASALAFHLKDNQYRKPTQVVYADLSHSNHPVSHPSNGDGQWVLLSTTKGYQFPKNRQRSLKIEPNSRAVNSHRSVRLTVLPAVDGSKENMTTSHGGMLEVEPSFHTVDESRKIYEDNQRLNATKVRPTKLRNVMATDASPDRSAVIAAVGAGLVPATMAMIMPMVLGRKKRSASPYLYSFAYHQNVTQHPHLDYESTLQRTL